MSIIEKLFKRGSLSQSKDDSAVVTGPHAGADSEHKSGDSAEAPTKRDISKLLAKEDSAGGSFIEEVNDDLSMDDATKRAKEAAEEEMHEEDKRQKYVISKEEFVVDPRYKPIKKLGAGAYGMVCSATDEKQENKKVAIKKIRDVFHNLTDAKRILREIKLLQHFNHPNIMKMQDMINPLSKQDFEDLYMVVEFMQSDLHRIIYSDNELSEDHIAYIVYQILCGLKYIHSAKVIHRDLKPGNILINADCQVKICDLGLARGLNVAEDEQVDLTEYVVTRWYRAPEVMVSAQAYEYGIDVWAVGCILGELFNREPLFQGDNYVDQLNVIFGVLGTPTPEDLECILNAEALQFVKKLKKKNAVPLRKVFPNASSKALDLLSRMLVFNPKNRITVDEALKHPFFKKFYNEEFINSCVCPEPFNFEFEKLTRTKENIQDLMFQEIIKYRPHAAARNPLTMSRRNSRSSKHRRSVTQGS
eukprot:TRINITY_DN1251_c0_g1_i1.p1 TRINITY_DN1251_c0_g1~~TRINITY_DN1251_c0_g1_i1.p1  ORF type:complete len:474 (+),score=140.17 TRINITY_DN1251_c0_g1_i1:58-1479(+)